MIAYLDTSAFLKLLVEEPGTDQARPGWRWWDPAMSTIVLYAEARAALAQARRLGRLGPTEFAIARAELESRWEQMVGLACTPSVVSDAGELAETEALRGYDALHLATALAVGEPELVFVTWDAELAAAARRNGLAVAP